MATTLVRFQHRRKTAAAWTSSNEVLLPGEPGVETDTGKWKLGDGGTPWTALTYQPSAASVSAAITAQAATTAAATAATYATITALNTAIQAQGAQPPQKLALTLTSPPRRTYVQTFQAGHGYALLNGDGTANLDDSTDHAIGSQSVKIVTQGTGTGTPLYKFGFTPAIDLTGRQLAILVKVDQPEHLALLEVWAGTGAPAPYYAFTATNYLSDPSNYVEKGKWVWVVFPWSGAANGAPNRAAITAIQVNVKDDNTGNKVTVHLQAIATVPTPTAGAVMFDFDDGFKSQEPAIEYLGMNGYPSNLYPVGEQVDQGDQGVTANEPTTTAFLQQAQRLFGCVVGCHATTWAMHGLDLGTSSPAAVASFFVTNRKWLTDRGLNGSDFFAYPGGIFSTQALAYARQFTVSARTVDQRQRETLPPGDPHKLRVFLVTPALTLATFQTELNAAIAGKYLLNLVFHQIDGTNGPSLTVFKSIVDYCAAQGVPVVNAAQALKLT